MEIYLSALLVALSPQVVFALMGGGIGVLIKSKIDAHGWIYTIFISIGSLIAVGATSEYLLTVHSVSSIFLHMFIGVIIGIIGASILHSFNLFAPTFANKFVNTAGDRVLKEIDKRINKELK